MKKLFIITILIILSCSAFSQEVIRDTLYGSNTLLHNRRDVTHLTVLGKIDARTFKFMRDSLINLTYLDLSKAQIVAYEEIEETNPYWVYPKGRYDTIYYNANEIPKNAFYHTHWGHPHLKKVILPEALIAVGREAFSNCKNLTSIEFSDNLKEIGISAFASCKSLTSIELPENLEKIRETAFVNCYGLTTIILSDSLKEIGIAALAWTGLTTITIPKNVSKIDTKAFEGNKFITTIIIPENVKYIGDAVFKHCRNLQKISLYWQNPELISISGCFFYDDDLIMRCVLEVPFGTREKYANLPVLKKYWLIVEREQEIKE